MSQIGREHGCGVIRPASLADQQLTAGHVAREDIGKIRVGEVNESDVRDRGRFVRAWSGDLTAHKRPHRSWTVRCPRDDREAIGCRGFVIRDHVLDRRWIKVAIGIAVEVEPASDLSIPIPLRKQVGGGISVAIAAKRDDAILEGAPCSRGQLSRQGRARVVGERTYRTPAGGRSPPSAWWSRP